MNIKPALIAVLLAVAGASHAETEVATLTSTKDTGVVAVTPDVLPDGRLAIKVVAFNSGRNRAGFGAGNVRIATAAGKSVPVVPLETLIAELKAAGAVAAAHRPSNYGHPQMSRNSRGQLDVGRHVGANDAMEREISARAATKSGSVRRDEQTEQDIENLKAAVLQHHIIAPGTAAGGQVVTEKPKFGRKEERVLQVSVNFNGEQHDFRFAVAADR